MAAFPSADRALGQQDAAPRPASARVDYLRDIHPVFERTCFECHGPSKGRGQLRLHTRALAMKGGVSGPVIVPGKSEESLLVQRLLGPDGSLPHEDQMPRDKTPLSAPQIALIRAWIDQGAEWPAEMTSSTGAQTGAGDAAAPDVHWAYVRPVKPAIPEVSQPAWPRNPIDRFVLARLDRERLAPSPPASKSAWLRRVSLDLIGLPPTPAELEAFLQDDRADARDRVVDRLLASPHYGERWAQPWLDLARYADTHGFEKDDRRSMWLYRDWVIDALNADMPFDRFTIEQIAGDMLPDATTAQRIASGFHRNTMINEEGGVDPEEALHEVLVDRVNTTATVWLGSTVACAQCHNHKYDPFSQKDYYRLLAFFQPTEYTTSNIGPTIRFTEATLELPSPEQASRRAELDAAIERHATTLKTQTPQLAAAQTAWEASLREASAAWTPLVPSRVEATGGVVLTPQADGSVIAAGTNAEQTVYTVVATTTLQAMTAVRLEALPDERLPHRGPGRDPYGNFRMTGIEVDAAPVSVAADGDGGRTAAVPFDTIKVDDTVRRIDPDVFLSREPVAAARRDGTWIVDATKDDTRVPRQAVLVARRPFGTAQGTRLTVRVKHLDGMLGQGVGRFRLSVTTSAEPARLVEIPARLRPLLSVAAAQRTPKQQADLAEQFRAITPLLDETRTAVTALRKARAELAIPTTLVMKERPSFERPSTPLRDRGSFTAKGAPIFAGVPAALHAWPESAPLNRLGLARWLVDPANPLVARVTVNRLWERIFGRGLVETSEDFGTQGSPPSHPELLDWLATEFVDRKWSQKALLRLIVTSATYAQEARVSADLLDRDPYNRLLARGPRFRLDAETIRDVTLAVSGLLTPTLHGPSVFPPQPDGIWNSPYNSETWKTSTGPDRYRRSLYTFIKRTSPYPTLMALDASSREYCVVRRARTNTPLQALALLNDEAFFEAAQALARRLLTDPAAGSTEASRAAYGFRLVTARVPDAAEVSRLVALYTTERAHYRQHPDDAGAVAKASTPDGPAAADAAERAAWTIVANVLLNLDETVTKE